MRLQPTALAWIDTTVTNAEMWDQFAIRRLARHLGYVLLWPPENSILPLPDQIRESDVDAVIMPSPAHIDVLTLNAVMGIADVEMACPRLTFGRWSTPAHGRLG